MDVVSACRWCGKELDEPPSSTGRCPHCGGFLGRRKAEVAAANWSRADARRREDPLRWDPGLAGEFRGVWLTGLLGGLVSAGVGGVLLALSPIEAKTPGLADALWPLGPACLAVGVWLALLALAYRRAARAWLAYAMAVLWFVAFLAVPVWIGAHLDLSGLGHHLALHPKEALAPVPWLFFAVAPLVRVATLDAYLREGEERRRARA